MRRISRVLVMALALAAVPAMAQEEGEASTGGGGMRRSGYLLDRSSQSRQHMLSFFGGIPYRYAGWGLPIGIGARYYLPLVHNGFIPPINDSFGLEFGADLSMGIGYNYVPLFFALPVEAMWNFHFTDRFAAYAKLGLAVEFNTYSWNSNVSGLYIGLSPVSGVGILFKPNPAGSFYLRAEVGYPWTKIGIGFGF